MISVEMSREIRLLVVDDAPSIRDVVKSIIDSEKGLTWVDEAEDGVQAVEKALSQSIDVVLMDMVLPNKNGIDACREILEKKPDLKIVAFSTLDQKGMVTKALQAGCCHYLTKPFSSAELTKVIRDSVKGTRNG